MSKQYKKLGELNSSGESWVNKIVIIGGKKLKLTRPLMTFIISGSIPSRLTKEESKYLGEWVTLNYNNLGFKEQDILWKDVWFTLADNQSTNKYILYFLDDAYKLSISSEDGTMGAPYIRAVEYILLQTGHIPESLVKISIAFKYYNEANIYTQNNITQNYISTIADTWKDGKLFLKMLHKMHPESPALSNWAKKGSVKDIYANIGAGV